MARFFEKLLNNFGGRGSLTERVRRSFIAIIALMLIPAAVSIALTFAYSQRYHTLTRNVKTARGLVDVVQTQIPDEIYNIYAGRKAFANGAQYRIIAEVTASIDSLLATRPGAPNNTELLVARRAMNTMLKDVDRLGAQIERNALVDENALVLDAVRGGATLVATVLSRFIMGEIDALAAVNDSLRTSSVVTLALAIALMLGVTAFATVARKWVIRSLNAPIEALEQFAGLIAKGNLVARAHAPVVAELSNLTVSLNTMAGKLEALIEENRREQENLKMAELRTLQAQITPHFLYNTLDAIVWLAETKRTDDVIHITRALSDFFRISLSQGRDWIAVKEEIEHTEAYLTIQKTRYWDILDYQIDVPDSIHGFYMLKLLLQPLVENAIYHGIKHRRGRGLVTIRGFEENGMLCFSVGDNGTGMDAERLEEVREALLRQAAPESDAGGYGLYNVNKRIMLYYNQPTGLAIESHPGEGTVVSFRVPVRRS